MGDINGILLSLQYIVTVEEPRLEGDTSPSDTLRLWLETLLKHLRLAMQRGIDPRIVTPRLYFAWQKIQGMRKRVGEQAWAELPMIFHEMWDVLKQFENVGKGGPDDKGEEERV